MNFPIPPSLLSCPEIVFRRHERLAYRIYTLFYLFNNLIDESTLVAGGRAVFATLTRNEYLGSLLDSPYHRHGIHCCRRSSSNTHLRLPSHDLSLHLYLCLYVPNSFYKSKHGSPAEIWRLRKAKETSSLANSCMTVVYKLKFPLNS